MGCKAKNEIKLNSDKTIALVIGCNNSELNVHWRLSINK